MVTTSNFGGGARTVSFDRVERGTSLASIRSSCPRTSIWPATSFAPSPGSTTANADTVTLVVTRSRSSSASTPRRSAGSPSMPTSRRAPRRRIVPTARRRHGLPGQRDIGVAAAGARSLHRSGTGSPRPTFDLQTAVICPDGTEHQVVVRASPMPHRPTTTWTSTVTDPRRLLHRRRHRRDRHSSSSSASSATWSTATAC